MLMYDTKIIVKLSAPDRFSLAMWYFVWHCLVLRSWFPRNQGMWDSFTVLF